MLLSAVCKVANGTGWGMPPEFSGRMLAKAGLRIAYAMKFLENIRLT
jgi:hypothetical protein